MSQPGRIRRLLYTTYRTVPLPYCNCARYLTHSPPPSQYVNNYCITTTVTKPLQSRRTRCAYVTLKGDPRVRVVDVNLTQSFWWLSQLNMRMEMNVSRYGNRSNSAYGQIFDPIVLFNSPFLSLQYRFCF